MAKKTEAVKKIHDHYFKKAKAENYLARSAYKLEEIQKKFRLLSGGQRVLDVGCAPGSWLQFAGKLLQGNGALYGIDLKPVQPLNLPRLRTVIGDITRLDDNYPTDFPDVFDGILSDAAPGTTGDRFTDHIRSVELCRRIAAFAEKRLTSGGYLVMKMFAGEDSDKLRRETEKRFSKVSLFKPKSSRAESVEVFIVALNKK